MRQITVIDELEAAEFRVASEFRVFVYAGAANDVTVYGIPGCPVEQALETAAMRLFAVEGVVEGRRLVRG